MLKVNCNTKMNTLVYRYQLIACIPDARILAHATVVPIVLLNICK